MKGYDFWQKILICTYVIQSTNTFVRIFCQNVALQSRHDVWNLLKTISWKIFPRSAEKSAFFQKICLFFKDKYFAKMWFIYFDRKTCKKMFPTLMLHSSMQEYSLEEKKSKNHLNFLHFWDAITIWNKNHFDFLKTYHVSNVTSILQK